MSSCHEEEEEEQRKLFASCFNERDAQKIIILQPYPESFNFKLVVSKCHIWETRAAQS
jgi:hypothetical protein